MAAAAATIQSLAATGASLHLWATSKQHGHPCIAAAELSSTLAAGVSYTARACWYVLFSDAAQCVELALAFLWRSRVAEAREQAILALEQPQHLPALQVSILQRACEEVAAC